MNEKAEQSLTDADARRIINDLLDEALEHMQPVLEKVKEPNLRPKLRRLLLELWSMRFFIERSKDLDSLEAMIDRNAQTLKDRILMYERDRELEAEIRKTKTRKELGELKLQTLEIWKELRQSIGVQSHKTSQVGNTLEVAEKATRMSLRLLDRTESTRNRVEDILFLVDRNSLWRNFSRFKRKRRVRKFLRRCYDLVYGGLLISYLVGRLLSNGANALLTNQRWITIVLIIGALVRFYWISPWYRRRALETQRGHLLKSTEDFYTANMNLAIFLALKQKHLTNSV
jgi:hypothetical protein